MKIRIKGNSIRLRLTQTEVEKVDAGQEVQESVTFGKGQPTFQYALYADTRIDKISVSYANHIIKVSLPSNLVKQWASTEQVGMEEKITWDNGATLQVLVEKDFQCLHKRPAEDESDNFPNPAEKS